MKKPRILVVGSINMDLILHMKALPRSGEAILSDTYHYLPGGKGENQATAAALLGAEAFFCGKTGDDDNGRSLREGLAARGVDVRGLLSDADAPTGLAAILVEDSGENRMMVYPGANMRLTPDDVVPVLLRRLHPDALMIQFEIPRETVIAACRAAETMGVPAVVDAGPAMSFPIEEIGPSAYPQPKRNRDVGAMRYPSGYGRRRTESRRSSDDTVTRPIHRHQTGQSRFLFI